MLFLDSSTGYRQRKELLVEMVDLHFISLPMTSGSRDSPIGPLPCALFVIVLGLRLLNRKQSSGVELDDILAVVAFVRHPISVCPGRH
jgi:hypothetical protein